MGLNYGFEIIAPRDSATRLVEAIAAHLSSDDASRLLAAAREGPERLMRLVRRDDHEKTLLCLTFLFEADDRIDEYERNRNDPVTGRVAIGCVWSTFTFGERFVLFRCSAATTSMSLVFEHSSSVWGAFSRIGEEGGSRLVTFHDDECELIAVWPRQGRAGVCLAEEYDEFVDGEWSSRVDPYCEAVLAAVGTDGHVEVRDA